MYKVCGNRENLYFSGYRGICNMHHSLRGDGRPLPGVKGILVFYMHMQVSKNSKAYISGIQEGDLVRSINGKSSSGLRSDEATNLLRSADDRLIVELKRLVPNLNNVLSLSLLLSLSNSLSLSLSHSFSITGLH